jgi:HEPN domain-containing protein
MTKMRKFRKEYAKELLAIAGEDLETARVLFKAQIKRRENILFPVEQTIEKTLKAVLCALEQPVPLVREISILIDHLPEGIAPPEPEALVDFTQFATIRRYEEGRSEFSQEELEQAILLAERVLSWGKKLI